VGCHPLRKEQRVRPHEVPVAQWSGREGHLRENCDRLPDPLDHGKNDPTYMEDQG
jgi:hypothetical protein